MSESESQRHSRPRFSFCTAHWLPLTAGLYSIRLSVSSLIIQSVGVWWVLFHSFSLLDNTKSCYIMPGSECASYCQQGVFLLFTLGAKSVKRWRLTAVATESGLEQGGWECNGDSWVFKCSSLHFRNPHISDLMSSFSGSMQTVICCNVHSGHACGRAC